MFSSRDGNIPTDTFPQQEIACGNVDMASHTGTISKHGSSLTQPSKETSIQHSHSKQCDVENENVHFSQQPRIRQYVDDPNRERWVVFIRRVNKKIRVKQVTSDLIKHYPSVIFITEVNRDKLRVVFTNYKEANAVVNDDRFRLEYRVYVPARVVEIDGVVTSDSDLSPNDFKEAVGVFKNPNIPPVKIIDCQQLKKVIKNGSNSQYVPSGSFRITFEGSALPHYVTMNKILRLRVRLYVPKVMSCTNCKQLGHTKSFCSNKAKCLKCEGQHEEDACQKNVEKCVLCGLDPHDKKDCPKFQNYSSKLKYSVKERSKRSYAELVKKTLVSNMFLELSDSDDDSDSDTEYDSLPSQKGKRGRKHIPSSVMSKNKQKVARIEKVHTPEKYNLVPRDSVEFNKSFPLLSGNAHRDTSSTEPKFQSQKENTMFTGFLKLSTIIQWVLDILKAPKPIQDLLFGCIPMIANFGKQMTIQWPILSLIDFDG